MICLLKIENIKKMLGVHSEIRIIWLVLLVMMGIISWFLSIPLLSYFCGLAFVLSVMHYVDTTQQTSLKLAQHQQITMTTFSKTPLYLAVLLIGAGLFIDRHWMTVVGLMIWIYFFLRWLGRVERTLALLQQQIQQQHQPHMMTKQDQAEAMVVPSQFEDTSVAVPAHTELLETIPLSDITLNDANEIASSAQAHVIHNVATDTVNEKTVTSAVLSSSGRIHSTQRTEANNSEPLNLYQQLQQWIFKGNPVLKVAIGILLIGIILLLRFATEHWQLELAVQLTVVGVVCAAVVLLGQRLFDKNRGFALGLEGLGMAGLCLNLFFAYYNQLIPNLIVAALLFVVLMLITVRFSLKQQSIELALMAIIIAYIAPFTLPIREMSSVELLAYYWLVNLAVALLSSLRPWKVLTQITCLLTVFIGTIYGMLHPYAEQFQLVVAILAHGAIFIWLGFRYSQLLAKQDLQHFNLKPMLDLALVFGVPMVSYGLIYLIYFQQRFWQASLSLLFVAVYAVLYLLAKRMQTVNVIAQSYFSLMLIFIAFIPPILAEGYLSAMGWSIQALLIFIFALQRQSKIARYLAMALSVVAGLSGVYYLLAEQFVPRSLYWCLSLVAIAMVLIANSCASYRKQYDLPMLVQHVLQMFSAMSVLMWLIIDALALHQPEAGVLLLLVCALLCINEWMYRTQAMWSWWIVQCAAIVPIYFYAIVSLYEYAESGQLIWPNGLQRGLFVLSGLLLVLLILRTRLTLQQTRELSSFTILVSLGLASLALIPSMPYVSVVILIVLFALWSWKGSKQQLNLVLIWQSYSALYLIAVWIITSQLFAQSSFNSYLLPLINPFDAVSMAMLLCFLWMLNLQLKRKVDQGLLAIMAVLSVLWLSSYVLLRALHVYLDTPYNQIQLWQNATVQFSLTMLWVSLAFITMTLATKKAIRALWLLGASLLVIVTLKLVLFDLSHIGTLLRVGSFLLAGLIMLIIAYIAPMPELKKENEA